MSRTRIGALTIGQSPRWDLVDPMLGMLPGCDILQAGALDSLASKELPAAPAAGYPLGTRMRDGASVILDESFILPRLQSALSQLEDEGAVATILMCAGTFSSLHGGKPLFVPFTIGCNQLCMLNFLRNGVVTPFVDQEKPTRMRWEAKGFQPNVWTADLGSQDNDLYRCFKEKIKQDDLTCIVLDYFGHPPDQVDKLQENLDIPVVDLGRLAVVSLASTLQHDSDDIRVDEK